MTKRRVALIIAGVWLALIIISFVQESWAQINYPPGKWPAADPWRYVYPPECKSDLAYLIPSVTLDRTRRVEDMYPSHNGGNMGWFDDTTVPPTIYIDRSVSTTDWRYKFMLHHELCHALMYRLTGDALWHPRRRAWQSRKRSRRRSSPFARLSNR